MGKKMGPLPGLKNIDFMLFFHDCLMIGGGPPPNILYDPYWPLVQWSAAVATANKSAGPQSAQACFKSRIKLFKTARAPNAIPPPYTILLYAWGPKLSFGSLPPPKNFKIQLKTSASQTSSTSSSKIRSPTPKTPPKSVEICSKIN